MEVKEGLEIIKALETLAKAFGEEVHPVASWLCVGEPNRQRVINEAAAIHNRFVDAGVVERGAMLGIEITETRGGGFMASAVLSER